MMTPICLLTVCCKLLLAPHNLSVFPPLRWIVKPSICLASRVAIFYSISSDNQRLHDTLLLDWIVEMVVDRQREQFNIGHICRPLLLLEREKRQREHTTRKTRQREKKIIDGGWRGKSGGHRIIEKGGPCRTVLPKPRSIVMKMAVHMTTIAAEWQD